MEFDRINRQFNATARQLTMLGILSLPLILGGCPMGEEVESQASTPPPGSNNNAPSISGTPSQIIKVGVNYSFAPAASDPDLDPLTFNIVNRPNWATFDSNSGVLDGVPLLGSEGTYNDIVIAVDDGQTSTGLQAFSITVEPADAPNMPPEISGTPAAFVVAGFDYSFTPTAMDPDGDTLVFSILRKPAWATFNTLTGQLFGTPAANEVDLYDNIAITVSDGLLSSSLPAFSITVNASNQAPSISGTPAVDAVVDSPYAFAPTATDPDGNTLSFSINNRPSWATFNLTSGRLSGTPLAGDVGTYSDIRITVSDGEITATLAPFTISVTQVTLGTITLSWTPPTQNTDGSTLTDLKGYRIYYGTSPGNYPNRVIMDNPGLSMVVVDNLLPGTYYVVLTAINLQDIESDYSNMAQKTLN